MPQDDENSHNDLQVTAVVALAVLLLGIYLQLTWIQLTSAALLAGALFSDTFAYYFSLVWMNFAVFIGTINSKILLTLLFYGFLTPIAFLYRLVKGSPFQQFDPDSEAKSYFVNREKTFTREDFENPW